MNKTVTPGYLHGELRVLPSKSASHRAVMMAALAQEKTLLEPMQLSKDIGATLACAQALGLTRGAATAAGETEGFVRAEIWGGGRRKAPPAGAGLRGIRLDAALSSRWRSTGAAPCALIGHGRLMQKAADGLPKPVRAAGRGLAAGRRRADGRRRAEKADGLNCPAT